MKIKMKTRFIIALISFIVCAQSVYALDVPYLMGRVNDYAGILSEAAVNDLEKTLRDFEQKTTCQIALLTIKSLEGENLEQFSIKVAETWKLGQKKKDNGVLLLIAQNDRQMRIEVGYGLEGSLTDYASGRIIANEIVPYFKKGDYNAGITNGVSTIIRTITAGKYTAGADIPASADIPAEEPQKEIDSQVNDMPTSTRIIIGIFIFSILGIFTYIMLFAKGAQGIFMYFFLIPFWSVFPMMAVGTTCNFIILGIYLIGVPIAKLFFKNSEKGKKIYKKFNLGFASSGGSRSSSFRSSGSSGSSFSGGGGSFGGGGSSGRW
jgi:uncharacterized protein